MLTLLLLAPFVGGLLLWPVLSWAQTTQGTPFALYLSDPTDCRTNVTTAREDQLCIDDNDQDQWRCLKPADSGNPLYCDQPPEWAQVGAGTGAHGAASCIDVGTTDNYACDPTPAIASYQIGTQYLFKANTANIGSATLNLKSLGSILLKKAKGTVTVDLVDGDICANQWILVTYDGANMQVNSPSCNAAGGVIPPSQGGTGQTTTPDNGVVICDGAACNFATFPACNAPTTSKLMYDDATNSLVCGTDQAGSPPVDSLQDAYDEGPTIAVNASGLTISGLTSATQSLKQCFDAGCTKGKRVYYDNAASQWIEEVFPASDIVLNAPSTKKIILQENGTQRLQVLGGAITTAAGTTVDASASTSLFVPSAGGAAPTVGGDLRFDDTSKTLVVGNDTTTTILPAMSLGFDCDNAAASKLLWDTTTRAFSCGADGGGGRGEWRY